MATEYDYRQDDGLLFSESEKKEPEVCLGRTFASSEERREYYRNELRKFLKDPDFRAIEGFPIGEDEDIIALSDPPYYCACPNPWIPDFIREWKSQKTPTNIPYKREPFAADVSEGKNDPIYMAHTYHTKVPPKAIMRYLLHYTEPGDIVYDGFCGSGMTGVAAYLCGNKEYVESLGYLVDNSGNIYEKLSDGIGSYISKLGVRKAVLNDLSPAAYFISKNFNTPKDKDKIYKEARDLKKRVENEYGWMYETKTPNGEKAKINYVVWSDVLICPQCGGDIVFFNAAVQRGEGIIKKDFMCPHCCALVSKKTARIKTETIYDNVLKDTIECAKQVPIFINYSYAGRKYEKKPDDNDFLLLRKISELDFKYYVPIKELPEGEKISEPRQTHGYTHVHHLYTKRNLLTVSAMWEYASAELRFVLTGFLSRNLTRMNRFIVKKRTPSGEINGPFTGTYYIPSEQVEQSAFVLLEEKLIKKGWTTQKNLLSLQSSSQSLIPSGSMDYIFLDPPFGANLMYSELSFIWESWLNLFTDSEEEAIESKTQSKGLHEYKLIMNKCFSDAFRVLKPGHWLTVEFSNTDSSVWNAIQTSLTEVGFIIANVSVLDKKHGGVKAMTNNTSVKEDLIISLYKPDESFDKQITSSVGVDAVWTFVRKHLEYLPLTKKQGEATVTVPERDARIIYDRMLSYFVGHNMLIPISSPDFLAEMPTRFVERGGLYYLPEQAQKYDKMTFLQMVASSDDAIAIFVCDESSAIAWIRRLLKDKPMTLGEMTPLFMQELSKSWTKGEKKPELRELLEENFLCYDGKGDVPSQIHSYLSTNFKDLRNLTKDNQALKDKGKGRWYIPDPNKAGDLEKIREKALLKEFSLYENSRGKIREFRIEAVRAGFKKAWQEKNYALIKSICERMPSNIVEEDEKLLMWYSGALNRLGE